MLNSSLWLLVSFCFELMNFFSVCLFFACVMLLSTKGYYSMSPYDDGYVSFMYVCMYVSSLLAVIAQFPTSQLAFAPLSSSSSSPLWLYVCSPHPLLQILYISWCPFVLSLDCLPYPLVPTRLSYFKGFFDLICCKKNNNKKKPFVKSNKSISYKGVPHH